MVKGFPGEHSDIPKRACESLKYQPINYLVPKTDLSHLMNSSILQDLRLDSKDCFESPPSEYWMYPHAIDFDPLNDGEKDPIYFKRPSNLELVSDPNENTDELRFLKRLPQLGIRCLTVAHLVESSDIITKKQNTSDVISTRKREVEEVYGELSLSMEGSKRLRNNCQINPLNQVELGEKYIHSLEMISKNLGNSEDDALVENAEYWKPFGDNFILTEEGLSKILLNINKILQYPMVFDLINHDTLKRILIVSSNNIKYLLKDDTEKDLDTITKSVGFKSCYAILEILMISSGSSNIVEEEYFSVMFRFIERIQDFLRDADTGDQSVSSVFSELVSFTNILSIFVSRQPFLDELFVIKTICASCDFLLLKVYQSLNATILCTQADSIRDNCIEILSLLFDKYVSQRGFIIQEILSHADNIPVSRSSRKLKLLHGSKNLYASHFTVALVRMLQSVNIFSSCQSLEAISETSLDMILAENNELQLQLSEFVDTITSVLLERTFSNISRFRPIIESYTRDLMTMIQKPECSPSDLLLEALLTKLFQVFNPSQQHLANTESLSLQLVGLIAERILDIKMGEQKEPKNDCSSAETSVNAQSYLLKEYIDCLEWLKSEPASNKCLSSLWNECFQCFLDTDTASLKNGLSTNSKERIISLIQFAMNKDQSYTRKITLQHATTCYTSIILNCNLIALYEPALKLILSLLDQQKIKLKSGAIKCLSLLIAKDKHMLKAPLVKNTIKNRLFDSSASVRDAILDLLDLSASYNAFYQEINANFDDESVSVRKHVMRMNEKIFDTSDDIKIKTYVIEKLLRRVEDEEDIIIKSARSSVLERLILSIDNEKSFDNRIQSKTSTIVTILSSLVYRRGKTLDLLESFFQFFVLNPSFHEQECFERIKANISSIVNYVVEEVIENNSLDTFKELQQLKRLELLLFFANSPGSFISKDHIYALSPYLLPDQRSQCDLLLLRLFRISVKKLNNFKLKFLNTVEASILSKLSKLNTKEIDEALALCWYINIKTKVYTKILKVCTSCITQLRPYANEAVRDPSSFKPDGKVQRLIYLSAGFARLCHFGENEDKLTFLRKNEHFFEYITKCLLSFTDTRIDVAVRRIAIKNLVKLASSFPKLFNSPPILKVLDNEFKTGCIHTQLVIVECLDDFFINEEKKVLLKIGVNGTISSNSELRRLISIENTTESVNDGVCSALVSRYIESIMKLSLLPNLKEAAVGIKFLKLILDLNFTNPSPTVPTLIALSFSCHSTINDIANQLISKIFEQYESMLFNGLGSGLKIAVQYLAKIHGLDFYSNDSHLKKLQSLLSNSKKNSKKFLSTIKNLFVSECSTTTFNNNDELIFFASNMCQIDYIDQFELYELIHSITLVSDELDESIQDILSVIDDGDKNSRAFPLIIRRRIIENFKSHMFKGCHLSLEKISYIGTPDETELKGKANFKGSLAPITFDPIIFQKLLPSQIDSQCLEYQKEYENDY